MSKTFQKHGRFLKDFDLILGPVKKQMIVKFKTDFLPN